MRICICSSQQPARVWTSSNAFLAIADALSNSTLSCSEFALVGLIQV